eukprot:TRINITY_DN47637_c0_g1_i1.p1 TRINITY_DN47637_c0_g1~~TRINITY_DN47637_c0_g1_i1.p1  ORF type:complete len:816 (-),score=151.62 TRINITY_DN47637_c0_g1_i1:34-2445(-)
MSNGIFGFALVMLRINLVSVALGTAYSIRLLSVQTFGRVIHEFDPWFNYRAAEYLATHGSERFFTWFDHTAWYPLGRPVGTTIYPGMQFAAVLIWKALNYLGVEMNLNDVCVFIPAWFGVASSLFLGLLTYECTRCVDSAVWATAIVAILPAHLMRSVAGGFDNECVAIPFMSATFYFWCRSLRDETSWPWGVLTGVAYFCMVSSWGGYVFVVNLIGVHAAILMVLRHTSKLHRAYSLFFVLGTSLAVRIPVVGWTPLRSLEQMGPLCVFLCLQVTELLNQWRRYCGMSDKDFCHLRRKAFLVLALAGALLCAVLFQMGYFAPISSRVRGLFVKHTRTGNPLVDSVAEHQATSSRAYWQLLHYTYNLAPAGLVLCLLSGGLTDAKAFLPIYFAIAYYFSAKMNRLLLLLAPISAALGGTAVAKTLAWSQRQLLDLFGDGAQAFEDYAKKKHAKEESERRNEEAKAKTAASKDAKGNGAEREQEERSESVWDTLEEDIVAPLLEAYYDSSMNRKAAAALVLALFASCGLEFLSYCWRIAEPLSQASIIMKSQAEGSKEPVLIDDYREAYWWLRDQTPEDSRVLAWWDYGYQISGVANRTTLADGNTWNHEHIALIGRMLTGPESASHEVIRHLADYVLIWAGSGGDDLAKSLHMARIANSVYSDVCPQDPLCRNYRVDRQTGKPTEMMARSLLWKLHQHDGAEQGEVQVDPELFEESYTSKHGFVRIFKVLNISAESKAWASDPANWKCDAPGSWYCEGQYPPAIGQVFQQMKAFKQLEDFNARKDDKQAEEYHKAYMEKLGKA